MESKEAVERSQEEAMAASVTIWNLPLTWSDDILCNQVRLRHTEAFGHGRVYSVYRRKVGKEVFVDPFLLL